MYPFPANYKPNTTGTAIAPKTCAACDGRGQRWRLMCMECHGCGKTSPPVPDEKKT